MLAAIYRGIDDVRPEEVPIPEIGPGEALVRVDSCGVCGTDLKKIHYGLVEPPRIFGHEIAGTIEALGDGVTDWHVGDRVAVHHHVPCGGCYYCREKAYAQCPTYKKTGTTAGFEPAGGGFAQYIRVMDWIVLRGMVRIPDHIDFEAATFVEPVNTCLKAVRKANLSAGQAAVILGQGQIGLIFTQLVRLVGATAIACDPLQFRRRIAQRFNAISPEPAHSTIAVDPDGLLNAVRYATGERGADLAVVAVADPAVASSAFEFVRPGGTVMLFAQTRLGEPLTIDAGAVCMLEKDLIGSYSADIDLQQESAELIFSGKLNVKDLITHSFALQQIGEALALASSPRDNSLKVMIKPWEGAGA